MEYELSRSKLASSYLVALKNAVLSGIYSVPSHSGIFLPTPHPAYADSQRRLFIIGQETRGWRNNECEAKLSSTVSQHSIVSSMGKSLSFNLKKPKRSKFRQFYKSASSELCSESSDPMNSALWSNQFCISYRKKSSVKSPEFKSIKLLSFEILRTQFELLKPQFAIFTTGHSRDKYIKQCFPDYETVKVHTRKRLWEFKVGETRCFRVNHPRWGGSSAFLNQTVQLIQSAV